jgi:hypothetical protein
MVTPSLDPRPRIMIGGVRPTASANYYSILSSLNTFAKVKIGQKTRTNLVDHLSIVEYKTWVSCII